MNDLHYNSSIEEVVEIGAGNDGNAFRMDSKTGQIYIGTQNGCLLDDDATRTSCATINYERRPKFLLFVKTTDTGINCWI